MIPELGKTALPVELIEEVIIDLNEDLNSRE